MAETTQTYQELQAELSSILGQLQDSNVDIDEATVLYERGMEIVRQLQVRLDEAENTIKKIDARFAKDA